MLDATTLLSKITVKMRWIYWLNVADIILTLLFLRTGMFVEANVFMVDLVTKPFLSILIKLSIPLVALVYVKMRLDETNHKELIMVNKGMIVLLVMYGAVTLMHIFNIIVYIVVKGVYKL